jgi:lysophospholipase L1-like esterase
MTNRSNRAGWRTNILLAFGSIVLTAMLLGFVEASLRLAGLGTADASRASRLKYQQIYLPILVPGHRADGTAVLQPADKRLPFQSIRRLKQPGTVRIFTFGGSATAGLGYSPNVTFTRYLERMLQTAHPGVAFEVVNLGIVALASQQVRLLVADVCAHYDPDILIVYAGNNEFLEMHAEKYARRHANVLSRFADEVRETNLYRVVDRIVSGPPKIPSVAQQNFSNDDLRLSEAEIIADVDVSPVEVASAVDRYDASIEAMAEAAGVAHRHLVLMTVASNWKWRGRSDLPDDWVREVWGHDVDGSPETWRRTRDILSQKLESAPARQRHEWLFRRAVAAAALGDFAAARADYRAAMNEDPHLRRALDAANDRVRHVAQRSGVALVDTVEVLSHQAEHGIVGFDEFYDYVHFTPLGNLRVAAALFDEMHRQGWLPDALSFDPQGYVAAELERIRMLEEDPIAVLDWMGFGFTKALLHDRDLWKYEHMTSALDERLKQHPDDVRALVYRGNARFFELDGAAAAARDYTDALALAPAPQEVRDNLERLRADGRL